MKSKERTGLKIGILVLVSISTYCLLNNLLINRSFANLKNDFLDGQAFVLGRVEEINPDIIDEIMIADGEDSVKKGREILKEYGYDESLKIDYMISLNENLRVIKRNNIIINIIMVVSLIILLLMFLINLEKKINNLTKGVKSTLEGKSEYEILKYEESSYGKLAFTIDDVRKRLENNLDDINTKKNFLSDLLSDVSHQLKTPISALKMYNEIMEDGSLTDEEREMFIYNSKLQISRMEWLTQNLLKLAKLDSGFVIFNFKVESLRETLEESIKALENKANEKEIKITLSGEEANISHDKDWLKEAFINIIKNDIENSYDGGSIEINVEDTHIFTRVSIKDYGKGIEEDELPKIFNRFYKSKNNKSKESIGIGLSLSKSIVEGHSGIITVESELGKGTIFRITLVKQ